MEKQEKAMRPIPKNVRQIGEREEEIKLYIEDYVHTFIRKCARSGRLVIGALIGDYYQCDGRDYLFVDGAVEARDFSAADGRVKMTDESWSGLYGKISEFFPGRSICGWFICSPEPDSCSAGMIRGFMYENIGQDKRVLITDNGELEEETFSVYDEDMIREQSGYYLFYERNEAMQSYMVTTVFATRTDPVAADAVTTSVRTRLTEKREVPARKSGFPFVSAAALVVGVVALAFGIVMINHYEELREMDAVLTGLENSLFGSPGADTEEESETAESSGFIVEDVSGRVSQESTEESTEERTQESTGSSEAQAAEGSGTVSGEGETKGADHFTQGQEEGGGKDTEGTTEEADPADSAGSYQSYLVKKGDTLVNICWKIYGYRDDAVIDQICEINRLTDRDHIYAGQELLLPR